MSLDFVLSALGLGVLLWRTQPWRRPPAWRKHSAVPAHAPGGVSIIVPCRNEERNIEALLFTLKNLDGPQPEIIVVDDHSTDRTREVAEKIEGVRVLAAPAKPEGWVGKTWACLYGAKNASGQVLLFTDADTRHQPDSLLRALSYMQEQNADMISAPPYHLCQNAFEKILGFFHILPLIAAPTQRVNTKRVYAIGQYLLIRREAYWELEGHASVRTSLAEDVDLATCLLRAGFRYSIYPVASLFSVQMYNSACEFWAGWKRLIRLGMRTSSLGAFVEIVLVFHPFLKVSVLTAIGVLLLAVIQRKHGAFSILGALLAFVSILLFTLLSCVGLFENMMKKGIVWHGRVYK